MHKETIREREEKKRFKAMMTENFPKLMIETKPQIQEVREQNK